MAKFKVGDRVKYTGRSALIYGKTGSVGTIKSVDTELFADGYPLYGVEFPETRGGLTDIIGEKHLRLANSRRNSVAANALDDRHDEVACNVGGDSYTVEFNNGMTVKTEAHSEDEARFNMQRLSAKFGGIRAVTKNSAPARNAAVDEKSVRQRLEQIYRQLDNVRRDLSQSHDVELRMEYLQAVNDALNALDYD